MNSLRAKAETLPRVSIDAGKFQEVVIEVKFGETIIAEHIIQVSTLTYAPVTGNADFTLQFTDIKKKEIVMKRISNS